MHSVPRVPCAGMHGNLGSQAPARHTSMRAATCMHILTRWEWTYVGVYVGVGSAAARESAEQDLMEALSVARQRAEEEKLEALSALRQRDLQDKRQALLKQAQEAEEEKQHAIAIALERADALRERVVAEEVFLSLTHTHTLSLSRARALYV